MDSRPEKESTSLTEKSISRIKTLPDYFDAYFSENNIEAGYDEEKFKRNEQIQAERAEHLKEAHFVDSGVGKKFRRMRISDYKAETPEQEKNLEEVKKFINDVNKGITRTLWLCGENGNGKTLLGSIIAYETLGNFIHCYDIDDDLKDSASFANKRTRKDVFRGYTEPDVLIIDEVGRFPSPSEKEALFHILNDRYEEEKPSVIISNLSREDLGKYFGKALTDRFIENCTCLNFTEKSKRREVRNEHI